MVLFYFWWVLSFIQMIFFPSDKIKTWSVRTETYLHHVLPGSETPLRQLEHSTGVRPR